VPANRANTPKTDRSLFRMRTLSQAIYARQKYLRPKGYPR
jgi:hypothetical protein